MAFHHGKELAKDSFFYGLPTVLPQLVNIVLIPVYTAYLSPQDYGLLGMLAAVAGIMNMLFWLNMNTGVLRFYHEYYGEDRRRFLGTVAIGSFAFSLILSIALLCSGNAIFILIFKSNEIPFYPFMTAQILIVFFGIASIIPGGVMKNERKAKAWSGIQLGAWAVTTALTLLFVVFYREGAWGKIKAQLVVAGILFVIYWIITLRHIRVYFSWHLFIMNLKFGMPLLGKSLFAYIYQFSDRWILERFVSLSSIGYYSFADSFANLLRVPALAFSDAWLPYFFREASKDEEASKKIVAEISYYWAVLLVCATLFFCLFSRTAILLLANERFHVSIVFLNTVVLSLAYLVTNFQVFALYVLSFSKRNMPIFYSALIASVANLAINMLLIPKFGVIAASLSRLIAAIVSFSILYWAAQSVFKVRYQIRPILKVLCLAAVAGIVSISIPINAGIPEFSKNAAIYLSFIAALFLLGLLRIANFKAVLRNFGHSKKA